MDTRGSGTGFSSILDDFGTYFESFWALRLEISISFRACFQVTFVSIFESKFGRLGLLKPGFRMKYCKNQFSQKLGLILLIQF